MASSNRHWPSMFKSKITYTTPQDQQWQSHRASPNTSGCDERNPEPKPRWNPKPEQIRILESIFNSGLVNPPRDEIRRIRARLQEYGQVADASIFYWFQNRKSRSKHKNRHLQKSLNNQSPPLYRAAMAAAATSSSSSSGKSSSKSIEFFLNSPTGSVNQKPQACLGEGGESSLHQHQEEFFQEPFFLPVMQQKSLASNITSFTQGFSFPELGLINQENNHINDDYTIVSSGAMLPTDLMMNHQYGVQSKNSRDDDAEEDNIIKKLSHGTATPLPPPVSLATSTLIVPPPPTTIVPSTPNNHQGVEEARTPKLIVFVSDVPYEVDVGPFNVKEAFGDDVVLIDSSGQTVVTDEYGITLQSLQHGAFYYQACSSTYDMF